MAAVTVLAGAVAVGTMLATAAGSPGSSRKSHLSTGYGVGIQATYDRSGNPSLVANFAPDGSLTKPRWAICSPPDVSVCRPAKNRSQFIRPGPTPAGTVFKASAAYNDHTYMARTAVWLGRVGAVRSPWLEGKPQGESRVRPRRGVWRGGWRPDPSYKPSDGVDSGGRAPSFDSLSVEACRTRSGTHCVNLTPQGVPDFAQRPAEVPRRFIGWYLFAFDERFAADTVFAAPGYSSPFGIPPLKVGATVARSAPAGPVVG